MRNHRLLYRKSGSSLIEVVFALALLSLFFLGIEKILLQAGHLERQTQQRVQAFLFAKSVLSQIEASADNPKAFHLRQVVIESDFEKRFVNTDIKIINQGRGVTFILNLPNQKPLFVSAFMV